MDTDERIRTQAVERLEARRGFFIHLAIYVVVNSLLFIQWAVVTPGAGYWPVWTLIGWGIGLAFHGIAVFIGGREPSEERIEREMDKLRGGTSGPLPTA